MATHWSSVAGIVLVAQLGGCGLFGGDKDGDEPPPPVVETGEPSPTGATGDTGAPPAVHVLRRASKSSTISVSDDDGIVAMVTPSDQSLAIFRTSDNTRIAKVQTGGEPSAVVIHPDGVTAFVANRADGTVVRVGGIDGPSAAVTGTVEVGAEPTGLALSPTGRLLFVAEWAEGRVSVIDTATMTITAAITGPEHPRGLAVTNDGDADDRDETLIVPEFFGVALEEVSDTGRRGLVRTYGLDDFQQAGAIELGPLDSGFGVQTSPNQLWTLAVAGDRLFLPSVSVSPEPPIAFNQNVQPVLYVADLDGRVEDDSANGTVNLADLVRTDIPAGEPRFFLADIIDVAMVGSDIAYVLSRGADVIQRVEFNEATGTAIGSAFNFQMDIGAAPQGAPAGCTVPTGIVTTHETKRAYVNCWVSRRLGVVDLTIQEQVTTVEAANPLATPEAIAINDGRRFFHTGRGRWSKGSWSSCASCHPDGLTDNVTWSFDAGPRQTTSLDGSFSKGPGPQEQRIFNWTGIFDEIHDFERNTRAVSAGLGAVTTSDDCGNLAAEVPSDLPGAPDGLLGTPVKEIQDTQADNCTTDFDDIEAFVRTIRPPSALRTLDPAAVDRGESVFVSGGCDRCHSGPAFTVSRRFFVPSTETNLALLEAAFPPALPLGFPASWNEHTTEIGLEPGTGAAPLQVACAIRNVETFGVPGDAAATDQLELRQNGFGAQGSGGYNVPSLYGLAVGAPYLHHGQAGTLDELLTDPRWTAHLRAGNVVFAPDAGQIDDLVAYLLSIDADRPELSTPAGFDLCAD